MAVSILQNSRVLESMIPKQEHNRSKTQVLGRDAFELALSASKEDNERIAVEAGFGVVAEYPQSRDSEIVESPRGGATEEREPVAATSDDTDTVREDSSSPVDVDASERSPGEEEAVEATAEIELQEVTLDPAGDLQSSGADGDESAQGAAPEAGDPSLEMGESGGSSQGDPQSPEESGIELDASFEALDMGTDYSEIEVEVTPVVTPKVTVAAPSIPVSGGSPVEALGRAAFAQATSHLPPASASTNIQDVVDQIDKARGTMSNGHARVVVGEDGDRMVLNVALKNGTVNVEVKAADVTLGDSLLKGSEDLADALEKHGLSLGDMQSNSNFSGDDTTANQTGDSDEISKHSASSTTNQESGASMTQRTGVRIVA